MILLVLLIGLSITFLSILIGSQLAFFDKQFEFMFFGAIMGTFFGIILGSYTAGRMIRSSLIKDTLITKLFKLLLIPPGLWLSVLIIFMQTTLFGLSSEYTVELILPYIILTALSICITYFVARQKS